jgi:diguanylate cyclase (GGDEF)-like protein
MARETSKTLPAEVYVPFVQSLYSDGYILVLGGLTQGATALLVYLQNGRPIYLLLALSLVAAGLFRYAGIRRRQNLQPLSLREARKWEADYLVRGTVQGALLGFYCFVALYLSQDSLAEIASVCVSLASAVAIVGRNYASNRMVLILATTMTLPITAGLMLRGDLYNFTLGLICLPFFVAIVQMAARVRETFISVIFEKKKASSLAHRFDRALNTMSSGLVMFDADGKVAVANAEASEIFGMSDPDRLFGRSLHALLMRGAVAGVLTRDDALYVEKQLTQAFHDGRGSKLVVGLKDGRHLEFSASGGRDDLGVLTFEDVSARVESEEQIRYMARFDSQTDLPNRAHFHEIVAEAQAKGDASRPCALAVIDLDDFKNINDTLGHPVGDGLIRTIAQRLVTRSRESVIVSRFGGDEFMIYFDNLAGKDELKFEIDTILDLMNEPVVFAGNTLHVKASIGAVMGRGVRSRRRCDDGQGGSGAVPGKRARQEPMAAV